MLHANAFLLVIFVEVSKPIYVLAMHVYKKVFKGTPPIN